MNDWYDAVTVVETRDVELHGSVGIGYGIDEATREPVTFAGDGRLLADFAAALADGIPYVLALVPREAVLSREAPIERR